MGYFGSWLKKYRKSNTAPESEAFKSWYDAQCAGAQAIQQDLDNASFADLQNLAHILSGLCKFDKSQEIIDILLDRVEKSNDFTTRSFTLYITERCNLHCRHCFIYDGIAEPFIKKNSELNFKTLMKIIQGLGLKKDGRNLFLSGGEVFVRPDFEQIAYGIVEKGVRFAFGTNGMFPERLDRLLSDPDIRKGISNIQFSLDGGKNEHERIRGKGTFGPLVESIKIVKRYDLPVSVCTVLQKENENCVKNVEMLIRKLGIDNHRFQLYSQADRLLTHDIDRYRDHLEVREYHLAKRSKALPGKGCIAGIQSCIIRSNGIVEACRLSAVGNVPHLVMGDLREYDFNMDALLASDQSRKTLRQVGTCPGCALFCAR